MSLTNIYSQNNFIPNEGVQAKKACSLPDQTSLFVVGPFSGEILLFGFLKNDAEKSWVLELYLSSMEANYLEVK